MQEDKIKIFQEPIFDSASVPIEVAAKALNLDKQTVRIMLQQGLVDWGQAFKMPGSSQYTYLISPRVFWLATGYVYQRGAENV